MDICDSTVLLTLECFENVNVSAVSSRKQLESILKMTASHIPELPSLKQEKVSLIGTSSKQKPIVG